MTQVDLQVGSFLPVLLDAYPFNRLSPASHRRLSKQITLTTFRPGEVIVPEGELPSLIHCVVQGQVRVLGPAKAQSPTLCVIEAGEVIGWDSLLRRSAFGSIRAAGLDGDVLTLSLSADDFEKLIIDELLQSLTEQASIAELYEILFRFVEKIPTQLPAFDLKTVAQHFQAHQFAIVRHWFPQNEFDSLSPHHVWFISGGASVSAPIGTPIKTLDRLVLLKDSLLPVRLVGLDRVMLATVLTTGNLPESLEGSTLPPEAETVIALLEGLLTPEPEAESETAIVQTSYPIRYARSCETAEYAIACFWMLCDFLKIPYRPDVLRRWFTKFQTLPDDLLPVYARIAEAFGLRSRLVNFLPTVGGLGRLQTPAFVVIDDVPCVLYEVTPKVAVLGSPATGLLRLSPTAVAKQLKIIDRSTNLSQALLLERQPMTPIKRFGWNWFLPSLRPHRSLLFQILVASIFVQLLALANPLLTQQIIDKAIINASAGALPMFALLMLTFAVLEGILTILRTYLLNSTTNRIDLLLGTEIVRHLLNLPLNFFQKRPVGELATRISELENIRQFLTSTFLTVLLDVLFSGIYIVMMLVYSVPLTLCVLGFIPIVIGITLLVSPILQKLIRKKSDQNAKMQSYLIEILNGVFTMKSQSMESLVQGNWRIQYLGYLGTSFRTTMIGAVSGSINNIVNNISSLLVLWVGGSLVLQGEMTLGGLIAFRIIAGYVTGPLIRLSRLWQKFQETNLSMELLADVVDTPTEYSIEDANLAIPRIRGQVKYEAVNFSFQNTEQLQLTNINAEIPAGTFVGLVGQSGSGKSTMLKLLPRFYPPNQGTIYLDGYDISKVSISSLRQQLGIVPQDPVLFEGTIRDNITTFAEVDDAIVLQAAKVAEAHDFIMDLPNGYTTAVGERGSNLSGGQRQRIALARMVVSNPQLVILDEATSALDYETERRVCSNLRDRFKGKTLFFITHRLANLVNADIILYLHAGVIIEQGTHAQLLAKRQRYYSLFTQQA